MLSTELELNRYRAEMVNAQRVQARLLSGPTPEIPDLEIAAAHRPGFHVGGDFYDFFLDVGREEGREAFTFMVSDVCGRGVSAALMVGMTRLALRMGINNPAGFTPAEVLDHSNAILYEDFSRTVTFASAFIGRYEPDTRGLTYANAGHSPVIYIPFGGKANLLIADSAPIGVLPTCAARNHHQQLNAGDLLLIGTDGLAESYAGWGNLWTGYQQLLRFTEALTDQPAKSIADALFSPLVEKPAQDNFEQADDQTVVIIKCI